MFQPLVKPKSTHDGTKQCPLQVDTFHEYAEAAEVPEEAAPRWGTAEWGTMAKEEEDQQEVVNIAAWEAWARDEPQYDAVEVEDPAADGGAPAAGDGDDRDDAADDGDVHADGSWHTAADDTPAGAAAAAFASAGAGKRRQSELGADEMKCNQRDAATQRCQCNHKNQMDAKFVGSQRKGGNSFGKNVVQCLAAHNVSFK